MTIDDYNKAKDLVIKIDSLKGEISDLRAIMDNDTSSWMMEIRPSATFSFRLINHHGLLPEFLKDVYLKQNAKLHELEDELAKL